MPLACAGKAEDVMNLARRPARLQHRTAYAGGLRLIGGVEVIRV